MLLYIENSLFFFGNAVKFVFKMHNVFVLLNDFFLFVDDSFFSSNGPTRLELIFNVTKQKYYSVLDLIEIIKIPDKSLKINIEW